MTADERLDPASLTAALATLPGWERDGDLIRRVYRTDGWRGSMLVANAVAFICEAADHHADVLVTWPRVTISLSTHSAGGVTAKDLEVARLIDRHLGWRPPAGSSLQGPERPFVE